MSAAGPMTPWARRERYTRTRKDMTPAQWRRYAHKKRRLTRAPLISDDLLMDVQQHPKRRPTPRQRRRVNRG